MSASYPSPSKGKIVNEVQLVNRALGRGEVGGGEQDELLEEFA
jgi:hypothetical protein